MAIVMNEDLCSSFFIGRPRAGRWIGCYFFSAIRTAQTLGPGLAEQSRRNDAPVGRKGVRGGKGGKGMREESQGKKATERERKKKQNRTGARDKGEGAREQ